MEWVTGHGHWINIRDGVAFTGRSDGVDVPFFATNEALALVAKENTHSARLRALASFQSNFSRISNIAFWAWATSDKSAAEYVLTEAVVEAFPGQ